MLEFHVLTGRQAGGVLAADTFPCRLGRAADSDLRFDDPGIWDQHVTVEVRPSEGVIARRCPPALASVNGAPFEQVLLRNGDRLVLGSVQLRFGFSAPPQRTFRLREGLTWGGLALLCLIQAGLLYWLSN